MMPDWIVERLRTAVGLRVARKTGSRVVDAERAEGRTDESIAARRSKQSFRSRCGPLKERTC